MAARLTADDAQRGTVVTADAGEAVPLAEAVDETTSTVIEAVTTAPPTTAPPTTAPPTTQTPSTTAPTTTQAPSTTSTASTAAPTTPAPASTAPPTTAPPTTAAPTTAPPTTARMAYSDPRSTQVWHDLAACESGGNWAINTGNGYYGGLQFSLGSWESVGGTGYPHQHPAATQIEKGRLLQSRQGWEAWPHCSAELGLR